MSILAATHATASHIWLVDANPLGLPEPPAWWQQLVFDYDKMLRVMPSQKDAVYRLCRLVRQDARLGLNALVVHDHPDTRACIKFGVVPVATLQPWAIRSNKIIRDLAARDSWHMYGGDPGKIVDAMEAQEADATATQDREKAAEQDALLTNAFRAVKYGRPETVMVGQVPMRRLRAVRTQFRDLPPLPPLPGLQNRDRVSSAPPPEGTVTPTPKIVLTDL